MPAQTTFRGRPAIRPQGEYDMQRLFNAVRLYGLEGLLWKVLARLLDGLSKKLATASVALSSLVARKQESRAQKREEREKEKRAD